MGSLLVYVVACAVSFFVSVLEYPPLVSILGLRTHVAYIPLLFLIPSLYQSLADIAGFVSKTAIAIIPVALLCIYQTTQSPGSVINVYASGEAANAIFGGSNMVRATGTFSYITGMAHFSAIAFAASLAGMIIARTRGALVLSVISLWASIMAGVATGSRGPLFQMALIVLVVACLLWRKRAEIVVRLRSMLPIFFLGGMFAASYAAKQFIAMYERVSAVSYDTGGRAQGAFFGWVEAVIDHPIGYGLGAGHQQASAFLTGVSGFYLGAEEELTRIALEMGVLGFFAFSLFRIIAFVQILKFSLGERSWALRSICAVAVAMFAAHASGGLYTPIANAALWGSVGFALAAHRTSLMDRRGL